MRQRLGTHLNFFKGFEYEPTVDCAAMMASTGDTRIEEGTRRDSGEKKEEERRWRFWPFKTKTLFIGSFFSRVRGTYCRPGKALVNYATKCLPHVRDPCCSCKNWLSSLQHCAWSWGNLTKHLSSTSSRPAKARRHGERMSM